MLHNPAIQDFSRETHLDYLLSLPKKHAAQVYHSLLGTRATRPVCIVKWENEFGDPDEDISEIWFAAMESLHQIIPMNIHSIQFKFLHLLYVGNYALFAAGMVDSDECQYCSEPETFLHIFWECPIIQEFWFHL